jgi:hypothetical protein
MARQPYPSDLTDRAWDPIQPALPEQPGRGCKRNLDMREVVHAIFSLLCIGCQWRSLHMTGLCCTDLTFTGQAITLTLHPTAPTCPCPTCQ